MNPVLRRVADAEAVARAAAEEIVDAAAPVPVISFGARHVEERPARGERTRSRAERAQQRRHRQQARDPHRRFAR